MRLQASGPSGSGRSKLPSVPDPSLFRPEGYVTGHRAGGDEVLERVLLIRRV